MDITIAKNYKSLSILAASLVIRQLRQKKSSILGLPTGHTPEGFYLELAKAYRKKNISFKQVKTFNLDEYIGLKAEDSHSYHTYMKKKFFSRVDLPKANAYLPDGNAKNLLKECFNYEKLVLNNPLDLQILGIGPDGHIGFNEPGSVFNSKTRVVKLSPSTRIANSIYFKSLKNVPSAAITMGIGTIMKAKRIILLASGKNKAKIIAQALKGSISKNIPASFLQRHKKLIVILDADAASLLK